ncbi:MAG TPA: hypothetical protein DCX77_08160 [Acidimicrobiaceae bacterium]|nr:hypothetical protein [Acidimicrobiaceae bacterium]
MYLIPLALIAGAAAGLFIRGSTDYFLATRVVFWPIPAVGVALQALVGSGLVLPYPSLLTAISLVLIAITCAMNLHLTGASLILLGTTLNLIPLVLNGYVPVTVDAVINAGITDPESIELVRLGAARAFRSGEETLWFLGAVVPIGWLKEVFSFGDLIVACGLANLGFRVFFPLRETASYYDEAVEYDQFRDPTQPDPFEGYEPDESTWSAAAPDVAASPKSPIEPPESQPGFSTLEGSSAIDSPDEQT